MNVRFFRESYMWWKEQALRKQHSVPNEIAHLAERVRQLRQGELTELEFLDYVKSI